jgi:pimeloyl-ACP methyl ester carboxylesterase
VVDSGVSTFVLIHGGASSAAFWDLLVSHLCGPALAIDLPGRAGKPSDPMTLTVEQCVESIVADVQRAGVDDVVLVAHSSGGLFVPGVTAALAPRVRHIVLSSGCVPTEARLGLEAMKASYARRNIEDMDAARRDGRTLVTPGPPNDPEVLRHAYGVALDVVTTDVVDDPWGPRMRRAPEGGCGCHDLHASSGGSDAP